jgi:hypothetical protein
MTPFSQFAILAPVPLEHLQSGKDIAETEGFVAFGSRKWELDFRCPDRQRRLAQRQTSERARARCHALNNRISGVDDD